MVKAVFVQVIIVSLISVGGCAKQPIDPPNGGDPRSVSEEDVLAEINRQIALSEELASRGKRLYSEDASRLGQVRRQYGIARAHGNAYVTTLSDLVQTNRFRQDVIQGESRALEHAVKQLQASVGDSTAGASAPSIAITLIDLAFRVYDEWKTRSDTERKTFADLVRTKSWPAWSAIDAD